MPKVNPINWMIVLAAILGFFLAIQMMGQGLQELGKDMTLVTNGVSTPYIGLFIGLLTTAILQSSSTTTALAVTAVASGSIALDAAIPIILGANVGTTITSTIVAFGFITKSKEFRRAVSAAMIHDMFNILGVLIIFPIELRYHFLKRMSSYLSHLIHIGDSNGNSSIWLSQSLKSIGQFVLELTGPIPMLLIAIMLLFASIKQIGKLSYKQLVGDRQAVLKNVIFKNPLRAFGLGLGITSIVQSSSLTSSLIVPLVATGKVRLDRAFYFLMGSNIGTTITALIAALFSSEAAMSLAIAHFLFNTMAVLLFAGIPFFGKIPLYLAERLGYLMFRYRISAFAYITLAFFAIPFGLIYLSNGDQPQEESAIEQVEAAPR